MIRNRMKVLMDLQRFKSKKKVTLFILLQFRHLINSLRVLMHQDGKPLKIISQEHISSLL